jgi:hypothetical protein
MPGFTQNVTLKINKKGYVVAEPWKIPDRMIGDKLRFDSKNGKFRVVFDPWIFSGKDHPITDRRARTIRKRGEYDLECYVGDGIPYGDSRKRGAHGNVKP